jgi:hypothetical protein
MLMMAVMKMRRQTAIVGLKAVVVEVLVKVVVEVLVRLWVPHLLSLSSS